MQPLETGWTKLDRQRLRCCGDLLLQLRSDLLQAGRGRYNWAIFDKKLYHPSAADHHAGTAADFAAALTAQTAQPIWLVGEAAPDLLNAVAWLRHVTVVDGVSALRRAGVLAQLAAQQMVAGQVDDVESLQPLYLQGP